jgi:hypothetical protein
MDQNKQLIIDFWYEFDKSFLSDAELLKSRALLDPYVKLKDSFLSHYRENNIDTGLKTDYGSIKDAIKLLADNHSRIIDRYLGVNNEKEQMAFELFAQGLLFDDGLDENSQPRRISGNKIHMMDDDMRGYLIWHAFVRLAVALLYHNGYIDSKKWLHTDRCVGLAAGILAALIKSGMEPEQTNDPTYNKSIDPTVLEELRADWLHLTFHELDHKIVQLYYERYNI